MIQDHVDKNIYTKSKTLEDVYEPVSKGEKGRVGEGAGCAPDVGNGDVRLNAQAEVIERLLREISLVITKKGRDILSYFEITPPQFHALLALKETGELTMGELCQAMYLACSTVTDLTERMQQKGYVSRTKDPNDRRVIKVRLEDRGREIIDHVLEERRRYLRYLLQRLGKEEVDEMMNSLMTLRELINSDFNSDPRSSKWGKQSDKS
ncbi:MAG TPA: MarR family transcriptional regulator [Clostridia bacterium]|nr:MarR family transcriptional regulator [Clostridia bacterium]